MVEQVENPYARLLYWEVTNFMSLEHARCSFDERNIVNFKGYNDSGKSAMLLALKILFTNCNPSKQLGYIQDDKEYFRVVARFEDGVLILRDKYLNGQSLYEMYKDDVCIYTSKCDGVLTRITEVPQPIADYLGLITYDNICLNARSCIEKLLGVETTGSENYNMLNSVLKSEEIASASNMLNTDRNKVLSDINAVDSTIRANKDLLGDDINLKACMIDYLKEHDMELDALERRQSSIEGVSSIKSELDSVIITPELPILDDSRLSKLENIKSISERVEGIRVLPKLPILDTKRLDTLISIKSITDSLSKISIAPEVRSISSERLTDLIQIAKLSEGVDNCTASLNEDEQKLSQLDDMLTELQGMAQQFNVHMVKCPNCGEIFDSETGHSH